ncbi:PAS domain S-box protein [Desulfomonile tiedjei]|uniref:PAS domain S-box n=1 Tax=Desulfomonile tiedjei (strain ATCC 49306 / DSM 6799 / DCB-1) TaxID=706587 RepID=I4C0U0_DESTA|nr:PAS domain S-box protein [Desulfomonile tiedjei]AFM23181.1 PAS domain S-box [Desulfomonile tiedjei DSM 6799]
MAETMRCEREKQKMEIPNIDTRNANLTCQSLLTVLEHLNAAVWVIDQDDGRILFANHDAETMYYESEKISSDSSASLPLETSARTDLTEFLDKRNLDEREYQLLLAGMRVAVQEFDVDWLDGKKARLKIVRDLSDMNRMEKAFIESEARFRATLDNAAYAIVLTDDKGHFTQVNAAWEKMFGYTAEEALSLTNLDVTHPDSIEVSKEKLSALVRGDLDFYRMEKQYVRKDGSTFWGDLGVTPVHGLDRHLGATVGVIADITDRKRMEESLRENEARFRATLDNLAQSVTLTDDTGRFTHVNEAFEPMFGYTPEEARNLTHLDVTHPDDVELSRERLQAVVSGELDFYRLEKRYVRKDGSVFWGDLTCTPVVSLDRSVAAAVAVIVDISEQKMIQGELQKARDKLELRVAERTEELAAANRELLDQIAERTRVQEALKSSEERFRAIFETARDCIFIKDQNLKYLLVNPAMERMLELPASEIMQLSDEELFGQGAGEYLRQLDRRVLAGEIIETEHTRPVKGVPMTFLEIRAPMRDQDAEIIGICGISRNITERTKGVFKEISADQVSSTVMRSTLAEARMAAKTDIIILLTGESGAGKDHLASFIHDNSRRSSGPFYAINCAAIPPELAESELFGHEQGAFTGANRRKRGLLELAEGGTLLLNEIGELPLHLQAKLLTFLDSRSFTRVGGEKPVTVSARLIAATNRNLEEEVAKNRFRVDLFYRLNVLSIRVPPLRERIDDLPVLAQIIIAELDQELQLHKKAFISDKDMAMLCAYRWPGNVRELRNVLERALIVSPGPQLEFESFQTDAPVPTNKSWTFHFPPKPSYVHAVAEFKRNLLVEALNTAGGNKQEASRLLGITRHVLRRQLERLMIDVSK